MGSKSPHLSIQHPVTPLCAQTEQVLQPSREAALGRMQHNEEEAAHQAWASTCLIGDEVVELISAGRGILILGRHHSGQLAVGLCGYKTQHW